MATDQGGEETRIPQLAHDLANFIQAIHLLLEETDWQSISRPELLKRIQIMDQCSNHAGDVCRQLMEPNSSSQKQEDRMDLVDLTSVTEDFSGVLELFVGARGKLEISSDGQTAAFCGNATELRQILLDLVTNARDSLDSCGGKIQVRCGCSTAHFEDGMIYSADPTGRSGDPYVYLEIQDNGHGIPPGVLANFFQNRVSTKPTGHGLGISSVLRIVHRCGGTIGVHSADGVGTRVRCIFPQAQPSGSSPREVDDQGSEAVELDRPITILLIEDSDAVCRLTTLQLERSPGLDCEIVTANSLRDAIEYFQRTHAAIDVVISDMMLPDGLGSQGLNEIRAIVPDQPVIIMSGLPRNELESCFTEQQPDGLLFKPLHTKEIVALVKRVVSRQHFPR